MCGIANNNDNNQQPESANETRKWKPGEVFGEYYYLKTGDPFRENDETLYYGDEKSGYWRKRTEIGLGFDEWRWTSKKLFNSAVNWPTRRSIYDVADPGEGYRLLKKGEPFEKGDEWYNYQSELWMEEHSGFNRGAAVGDGWAWRFTYRRKVEVQPVVEPNVVNGYRNLKQNIDIIQDGDEYMEGLAKWVPVPSEIVGLLYNRAYMPMRRWLVERPITETKSEYIFLTVGDTVQRGDEYMYKGDFGRWDRSGRSGVTLKEDDFNDYIYRRRVTQ